MSEGQGTIALEPDRLEEAAQWWVTFQDTPEGELNQAVAEKWRRWKADPENRSAFQEMSELVTEVKAAGRPPTPTQAALDNDQYTGSVPVSAWRDAQARQNQHWEGQHETQAHTGPVGENLRSPAAGIRSSGVVRRRRVLLMVAAAASAVLAFRFGEFTRVQRAQSYETESGEHRGVVLADGSTIALGARTVLTATYTERRRTIVLEQGVAIFNVAHNIDRPFVVEAGSGSIMAVGTAFQVLQEGPRTVVTVTEGTVVVQPRGLDTPKPNRAPHEFGQPVHWQPARVSRGQEVTIDPGVAAPVIRTLADPDTATAWREGRLQYVGEPLRNVLADVNRYSRRQLTCEGSTCNLLYTGTVFERDIDAWINGLPRIFAVDIAETDSDHLAVHSRGNTLR